MVNILNAVIPVIVGDHDYPLDFTLQTSAGAVFDLTGATSLAFEMQLVSDDSVATSGAMHVVSATAGTCYYTVTTNDFPIAGTYNAQVVVNFGSERISFDGITVVAQDKVPV
jgi:hypothetical protein